MNLIEIKEKDRLNDFLKDFTHSLFLQSWDWGEFQKKDGFEILRLGVEDEGELKTATTLIKKKLPIGNYFYCPHGPVSKDKDSLNFFFNEVAHLAQKEKIMFLRFEPRQKIENKELGIKKTIDIQPAKTIILDLIKPEEELLKDMHQKTRYNIRLAEKKGVKAREAREDEFEKFFKLLEKTGKRDDFRLHNKDHYKRMLGIDNKYVKLFFGEFDKKIICAGIFSFFGKYATYMHGASADEHKNVMAPYLLHWHVIKLARAWGFKYYDFFGIDEKKWPGVTRFKRGFGKKEIDYLGTFDLVFDRAKYFIYKLGRKIRRLV